MICFECRDLCRAFERRTNQYVDARSSAFFQVSTRIAARKYVYLQRALSDLREHQADCPWAIVAERVAQRSG